MINAPCLKCTLRHAYCHDKCKSYAEFKTTKEQIQASRSEFLESKDIIISSVYRQKKHLWKKERR